MRYSTLLLALFLSFSATGQNTGVTLVIDGFPSDKGLAMIQVSNAKGEVVKQLTAPIKGGTSEATIADLPAGSYAVACFHDANGDAKLNTSALGMPKEAYGFSNNARGMFGPPDLKDQLVKFAPGGKIAFKVQ